MIEFQFIGNSQLQQLEIARACKNFSERAESFTLHPGTKMFLSTF